MFIEEVALRALGQVPPVRRGWVESVFVLIFFFVFATPFVLYFIIVLL